MEKIVKNNPEYSEVVCLCNLVSRAEILEVAKDFPSFDAVKRITRAGMDCNKSVTQT